MKNTREIIYYDYVTGRGAQLVRFPGRKVCAVIKRLSCLQAAKERIHKKFGIPGDEPRYDFEGY